MEYASSQIEPQENTSTIHFGHFAAVMFVAVLLLGISWMKDPALFLAFKKNQNVTTADSNVPHYYAYVAPAEDTQGLVAGASTQDAGPMIINDDGSVSPVDMGQILGASTQGVQLLLDDIKVNMIPDSDAAVTKYFNEAQLAERGTINQTDFASALSSGNQDEINQEAQKFIAINSALQKLVVPQSLAKLQKLKIIQYNSAIALLQNFTQADQNPELVNQNLQQFIKSQQDLDAENIVVAQKFPNADPEANLYINSEGIAVQSQADISALGSTNNSSGALTNLNNSDNSDAGQ